MFLPIGGIMMKIIKSRNTIIISILIISITISGFLFYIYNWDRKCFNSFVRNDIAINNAHLRSVNLILQYHIDENSSSNNYNQLSEVSHLLKNASEFYSNFDWYKKLNIGKSSHDNGLNTEKLEYFFSLYSSYASGISKEEDFINSQEYTQFKNELIELIEILTSYEKEYEPNDNKYIKNFNNDQVNSQIDRIAENSKLLKDFFPR